MKEIYMDIKGYEGIYQVSNLGNVKNSKDKILKPFKDSWGYMQVDLHKDGKRKTHKVHRLVLETFKPNSNNELQVNHLDENKTNNNLDNLQWCTAKDNINYGTRTKRAADKLSKPVYCITNDTVYKSLCEAARKLNLQHSHIGECCAGKRKSTGGYQFKYYDKGGC